MLRRRSMSREMAGRSKSRQNEAVKRWKVAPEPKRSPASGQLHPENGSIGNSERLTGLHSSPTFTIYGSPFARSVLADNADDDSLDQHVPLLEPHGLHGGISRLESDPPTGLAVKLLDRSLAAVDERDDH